MRNITAALTSPPPTPRPLDTDSKHLRRSRRFDRSFPRRRDYFRDSIGYRYLEQKLPSTSDTLYPIGSLSKAFTASIYGSLVDEGVITWNSPIRDMLPDSSNGSSEVETLINAIDLLSHRTGIAGGESLYFHAQPLLDDTSHVAAYAGLPQVGPFRSTMQYKNLGYGLVSQAMTQVTGKSYSDLLERYITQPLSLEWTGVGYDRRQLLNTANKYLVADDGSVIENPRPLYHEGTHALASGGIWSSVNDLLTFYQEVLKAAAQEGTKIKARQSPLKQLSTILKGHAFLSSQRNSRLERTDGLGWIWTQLPAELGSIGLNSWLVKSMPITGRSSAPRLTIYHRGNVPGATSAVYLFPDTMSGVVVLANAYGLSDVPDWIAQWVIETLFEEDTNTRYLQLAEETVSAYRAWCAKTVKDLTDLKTRNPDSTPTSLERYVGEYWNASKTVRLVIILDNNGALILQFQGHSEDEFELKHLHDDVFSWFTSLHDMAERGRHIFDSLYYLIECQQGQGKQGLRWAHDSSETGELFEKTESEAPQEKV